MRSVEVIQSVSRTILNRYIEDVLRKNLNSEHPFSLLFLTPGQKRSDSILKWVRENFSAVWMPTVLPFGEFIYELFDLTGDERIPVRSSYKRYIIQELLKRHASETKYFKGHIHFPGLTARIDETFSLFKSNGICNADEIPGFSSMQAKIDDLKMVFKQYQDFLHSHHLADREDISIKVKEMLEKKVCPFTRWNLDSGILIVDAFYYLTPVEEEIVHHLVNMSKKVIITVDYDKAHHPVTFKVSERFREFVSHLSGGNVKILKEKKAEKGDGINVSTHLFGGYGKGHSFLVEKPRITIVSCQDRREEMREIAKSIREILTSDPNLKYSHISVVVPDIGLYFHQIEDVFPAYGIPYEISRGYPLKATPLASLMKKLFEILLNGFKDSDVFSFFNSPLVSYRLETRNIFDEMKKFEEEYGGREMEVKSDFDFIKEINFLVKNTEFLALDMEFLDTKIRTLQIGGRMGGPEWTKKVIASFKRSCEAGIHHDSERFSLLTQLYLLNKALEEIKKLKASMHPHEFRDILCGLISTFHIEENLADINHRGKERIESKAGKIISRRDAKALESLYGILNRMGTLLTRMSKGKHYPLEDLVMLLFDEVGGADFIVTEDEDQVQITGALEMRGMSYKALIFAGLAEGGFPVLERQDFLIPNVLKDTHFISLNRFDESRFLFSSALRNVSEVLILTYPEREGNKEFIPSPFLHEVERITGISIVKQKNRNLKFTAHPLYSKRDALILLARLLRERGINEEIQEEINSIVCALSEKSPTLMPFLERIHEITRLRQSTAGFTIFDGLIENKNNIDFLNKAGGTSCKSPSARSHYSVTQIEQYARCPIAYFFENVLELTPVEEVQEEYDRSDKGRLIHRILEEFYRERIAKAATMEKVKVGGENLDSALKDMAALVKRVIHEFDSFYHNMFWDQEKEKLLHGLLDTEVGKGKFPGVLRLFLNLEASCVDRIIPDHVERGFKIELKSKGKDKEQAGAVRVSGKIDRIDICEDENVVIFYDYKTGMAPSTDMIGKGLSFQLPVYLIALKDYFKDTPYQVCAGGYYQLRVPSDVKKCGYFGLEKVRSSKRGDLENGKVIRSHQRKFGFFPEKIFQQILAETVDRIYIIDSCIRNGKFHLPLGGESDLKCKFCDYGKICRKDFVRLDRIYLQVKETEFYKPLRKVPQYSEK